MFRAGEPTRRPWTAEVCSSKNWLTLVPVPGNRLETLTPGFNLLESLDAITYTLPLILLTYPIIVTPEVAASPVPPT